MIINKLAEIFFIRFFDKSLRNFDEKNIVKFYPYIEQLIHLYDKKLKSVLTPKNWDFWREKRLLTAQRKMNHLDYLHQILLWVVVCETVLFLFLISTLLWVIRKTSHNCTLEFGFALLFSAIMVFIDGAVTGFALRTNMRDFYLLALCAAAISFLIFVLTILMNLILGTVNLLTTVFFTESRDEFQQRNFRKVDQFEESLPNFTFVLLLTIFGFALIALVNLVAIVTLSNILFPEYEAKMQTIFQTAF